MIDFKDVSLKEKRKCMCAAFEEVESMYVVKDGML